MIGVFVLIGFIVIKRNDTSKLVFIKCMCLASTSNIEYLSQSNLSLFYFVPGKINLKWYAALKIG